MISMNLKHLRTKLSLTQEQFAEKFGVSRQTVAKWESGESLPDITKCAEVAYEYGLTLDELVMCPLEENKSDKKVDGEDKYVFGISKVGERGQVVIPKHARDVYSIKQGDRILVLGDNRGMAFIKMNSFPMIFDK
ncbi:MAG: helix-turn-helix domain-containing protein [Ruminococcus sp.]|nr:helix-turn-helix domain-containing protein [Ruminococcus sp.]